METKVCPKCGRELPVEMFGKNKAAKDGYQSLCKEYTNARAQARRDRIRQGKDEAKAMKKKQDEAALVSSLLADFTPRQLMEELVRRGYKGTLTYTSVINIEKI